MILAWKYPDVARCQLENASCLSSGFTIKTCPELLDECLGKLKDQWQDLLRALLVRVVYIVICYFITLTKYPKYYYTVQIVGLLLFQIWRFVWCGYNPALLVYECCILGCRQFMGGASSIAPLLHFSCIFFVVFFWEPGAHYFNKQKFSFQVEMYCVLALQAYDALKTAFHKQPPDKAKQNNRRLKNENKSLKARLQLYGLKAGLKALPGVLFTANHPWSEQRKN